MSNLARIKQGILIIQLSSKQQLLFARCDAIMVVGCINKPRLPDNMQCNRRQEKIAPSVSFSFFFWCYRGEPELEEFPNEPLPTPEPLPTLEILPTHDAYSDVNTFMGGSSPDLKRRGGEDFIRINIYSATHLPSQPTKREILV
uniref:Uncharacterized protein n=1 Tax=Opuntia streptacantha TaxID=393608 RepID=A0A7C8YPY7_OPUST